MHSAGTTPRPARGVRRLVPVLTTLTALTALTSLTAAGAVPATARPDPSAGDVADARRAVDTQAQRLSTATAGLAEARARLGELGAAAERAVEAYNGERVRLAAAESAHQAAAERQRTSDAHLAQARADVAALAAQSYGGVDLTRPMAAVVAAGGNGGMPGYLHQASVLHHLSGGRAEVLKRMRDAQEVATILRAQASTAYTERREAAARAEAARTAAQAALDRQRAQTEAIEGQVRDFEDRLDQARSEADRLARERAAAQERAALQRDQAAVPAVGSGGSAGGDLAADWALAQLGKPYVWAAAGPDTFDCSGLTMRAWERAGVRLDHWTGTQWTSGPHIPLDSLRRGDLLFFGRITSNPGDIHHVGMYIGKNMMVHAPQTGDVVRIAPMWRDDLVGATRPG
ncbi:NlpC/P60 family protein [Spongiactinospora rosea]|uniref:NlpC/P60 family protein n=1 Tax=Spongiactinospora rosea TaxID=2248750 RepID=A0A366LJY4_9ACTN|nr:C40 family peptidase [Spongiactinospora rosea]RBQ14215.1 NlpC/P60 family protein [Spongiactinospora rosea]